MNGADKYKFVKEEITAIYHENKGRYGYRRITSELRNRNLPLNHKTVQRLGYPAEHEPEGKLSGQCCG